MPPTPSPGSVVSNICCRIRERLCEDPLPRPFEAAGAKLVYLPPYSPDLNPIEQLFAKLKALLRKAAERSIEALCATIGPPRCLQSEECANYLRQEAMRQSEWNPL